MIYERLPQEVEIEQEEKKLLAKAKRLLAIGTPNWHDERFQRMLKNPNYAKIHILLYLRSRKEIRPIRVYEMAFLCNIGKTNIYKYLDTFVRLGVITIQEIQTLSRYVRVKHAIVRRPELLNKHIQYALDSLHTTLEIERQKQIMASAFENRTLNELAENTIYVWEQEDGWGTQKMKRCEGTRELFVERVKACKDMGKKIRLIGKKEDMLEFE
jgi:hypothetical protein